MSNHRNGTPTIVRTLLLAALVSAAGVAQAQPQASTRPARTPKPYVQRPTESPDELLRQHPEAMAVLEEFKKEYYKVKVIPRNEWAGIYRNNDGTVQILPTSEIMVVVKETPDELHLRHLPLDDPRSSGANTYLRIKTQLVADILRRQYLEDKLFLDPGSFAPPGFTETLTLVDRSKGLPDNGLWQIGAGVGDFDGDGKLDVVLPPARKGDGVPHVFLQRGDSWQEWPATWPQDVKMDYGTVAVADFDGDGNLDIALASHFLRVIVLYGDGKGNFSRYAMMPDLPTTSRALTVGDFNGDGKPDIAALAELDVDQGTSAMKTSFLLTVFLNPGARGASWTAIDVSGGVKGFFGDHLAVTDVDGDGQPDIAIGSLKQSMNLFFLNRDKGRRWEPVVSAAFPYSPYTPSVAPIAAAGGEAAGVVFGVLQRETQDGAQRRTVNSLVTIRRAGVLADPKAPASWKVEPIVMDAVEFADYTAIAVADLNGDGREDIVAGRMNGEIEIYVRTPNGWLRDLGGKARRLGGRINDLIARDLDGKGHVEIVAMVGPSGDKGGSVQVFEVAPVARPKGGGK